MPDNEPEDLNPEDLTLLTEYVNTVSIEEVMDYLEAASCYTELAWLETARREAEGQGRVAVATAYAAARGELKPIRLTFPVVEDD